VRAPLWLAASALVGCVPPEPCSELAPAAAPHAEAHGRFADVARRIVAADSAFDDQRVLEESLFHSLRAQPEVLAAWVERSGPAPLALAHPRSAALPATPLTTCRVGGERLELGRVELAVADIPGPALLVRQRFASAAEEVVVTVAFVAP
jgi:hypothetical protein